MKEIIKVNGMHCEGCENRIKNVLETSENITDVKASHTTGEVEVTYSSEIDLNQIKEKINNLGFEVEDKNE